MTGKVADTDTVSHQSESLAVEERGRQIMLLGSYSHQRMLLFHGLHKKKVFLPVFSLSLLDTCGQNVKL